MTDPTITAQITAAADAEDDFNTNEAQLLSEMPTFVWTDYVPEWRRAFLTPGKRYHLKLGTVIGDDDDEVVVSLCDDREFDQYGRAWNVETVADPAPPTDPSTDILAARVTVAGRSMTVAEMIAAHERDQWQPIETAPLGTTILVAYDDGEVDVIDADENDYEWKAYGGRSQYEVQPTHWRPLPAPPAPAETEGA